MEKYITKVLYKLFYLVFFTLPISAQLILYFFRLPSYNSISGIAYKDAAYWELCSKSLAIYGQFPSDVGDWCLRRPVHIELISLLYNIFGSFDFIYLFTSILFSVTTYFLFKNLREIWKFLPSFIIVLVSLFLWLLFASNMLLSETSALILGNVASIYFLKSIKSSSLANIFILFAALFLIQIIRPGNVVIYIATFFLLFSRIKTIKISSFYVGILAFTPVLYYLVLKVISRVLGYNSYQTAGNSWATMYGLVHKNSTWQEAYAIVPSYVGESEVAINEFIRNETLNYLFNNPLSLCQSIIENFYQMLSMVFPFFLPVNFTIPDYLHFFFFIIQAAILFLIFIKILTTQNSFKFFTLYVFITTLIFYAASWKSEAARALSPTLTIFIIAIALFLFDGKSKLCVKSECRDFRNMKLDKIPLTKLLSITVIPCIFLSSTMLINRISSKPMYKSNSSCGANTFQFDYTSVKFSQIDSIRSFRAFSWFNLINELSSGVLIQGLATEGEQIDAYTVFLPGRTQVDAKFFQSTCFSFKDESIYTPVLQELNFREVFIP